MHYPIMENLAVGDGSRPRRGVRPDHQMAKQALIFRLHDHLRTCHLLYRTMDGAFSSGSSVTVHREYQAIKPL